MRNRLLTVSVSMFLLGLNSSVFAAAMPSAPGMGGGSFTAPSRVLANQSPSTSNTYNPEVPAMCKNLVGDCAAVGYTNLLTVKGNNIYLDCVAPLMAAKPRKPDRITINQILLQHVVECKNSNAPDLPPPSTTTAPHPAAATAPAPAAEPTTNADPGD